MTSSLRFSFVLLFLAGCAPGSGPIDRERPTPEEGRRVEVVGASEVDVEAGTELELTFRLVDDGQPVADALLDFALEGGVGASLAAFSAPTGPDGLATVSVRSGTDGSFEVEASAADARSANVLVTVRPLVLGRLQVEVVYGGTRGLTHAESGIFTNTRCEDLNRAVPLPHAATRMPIGATTEIAGLPLDVPMALYVMGIDAGDVVAAETCTDVTMTGPNEDVLVALSDVAVRVRGPYATTERFDVTNGFSSGLDTLLDVLGGLGGSDPAGWLIDEVAMSSSTPGWIASALSWSVTRDLVVGLLGDALASITLPSELTAIGRFGADANTGFSGMILDGELHFTDPDEWGVAAGEHRISMVRVPLSDGTYAMRPYDLRSDVVVTFADRITLDEHAFALPFGEVAEVVFYVAGLGDLPGAPETVGELVGNLFDCEAMAAYVGTGTTATLAEAACNAGVAMIESRVDDAMGSLYDYDTLHLSGDAALVDADGDYDLELIETGDAHARWVGASGELAFDGEFDGHSLDDAPSVHRVRERLIGLE